MLSAPHPDDPAVLEKLRRNFKTAAFIGLGLIAGLAVELVLVEIIRARQQLFLGFLADNLNGGNRPIIRYAFYAAAVGLVLLIRFFHGRRLQKIQKIDDSAEVLDGLSGLNVMTLSLAEIPAILGFILFLLAGYNRDFYVLLFVSLFLVFMYFPRAKTWEDILQHKPTSCPR